MGSSDESIGETFAVRCLRRDACLLSLAAVVYWQIREIERVLGDIEPEDDVPVDLLAHISSISRDNVVLYGEYKLRPELVQTGSA